MPTMPVFLPGESHEQKSLAGYSPMGCKESNMTKNTQVFIHRNCPKCVNTGQNLSCKKPLKN